MPPTKITPPQGRIGVYVGLNAEEWVALKEIAEHYDMTSPALIRQWIKAERDKLPK